MSLLGDRDELDEIGGKVRLHELSILTPATGNAGAWAVRVREKARQRAFISSLSPLWQLAWEGFNPRDALPLFERAQESLRDEHV